MEAKDLHKRLEEAAKESVNRQYNCKGKYPCASYKDCEMCEGCNTPYDCCECGAGDYNEGFLAGAESGYKEAIKVAKGWIGNRNRHACKEWLEKECADFETYMNKLFGE